MNEDLKSRSYRMLLADFDFVLGVRLLDARRIQLSTRSRQVEQVGTASPNCAIHDATMGSKIHEPYDFIEELLEDVRERCRMNRTNCCYPSMITPFPLAYSMKDFNIIRSRIEVMTDIPCLRFQKANCSYLAFSDSKIRYRNPLLLYNPYPIFLHFANLIVADIAARWHDNHPPNAQSRSIKPCPSAHRHPEKHIYASPWTSVHLGARPQLRKARSQPEHLLSLGYLSQRQRQLQSRSNL